MHPGIHSADWMAAHVLIALALVTAACALAPWLLRNHSEPWVIAELLATLAPGLLVPGFLLGDLPGRLFHSNVRPL